MLGPRIVEGVSDVTPTYLTPAVLDKLREADHLAQTVLHDSGRYSYTMRKLLQRQRGIVPSEACLE